MGRLSLEEDERRRISKSLIFQKKVKYIIDFLVYCLKEKKFRKIPQSAVFSSEILCLHQG